MKRYWYLLFTLVLLSGCAGFGRGCSSQWASATGANWIVVQYAADGRPFAAWKLTGVSVANETSSDGIYWKEGSGHLVHISGWYNRVQVSGGDFTGAAKLLGIDAELISNGKYTDNRPTNLRIQ
jgi:hypothetical protein